MKTLTLSNQKIIVAALLLLASLLQAGLLLAQPRPRTAKPPTDRNGSVHIRIERDEDGDRKVIERTYPTDQFSPEMLDSMDLPGFHFRSLRSRIDADNDDSLGKHQRDIMEQLRFSFDDFRGNALQFNLPENSYRLRPFGEAEKQDRYRFDQQRWELKEQKTDNGKEYVLTRRQRPEDFTGSTNSSSVRGLRVVPGQNRGFFDLNFAVANRGDVAISVADTEGREVFREKMRDLEGTCNRSLDLRKLAPGVYFLTVTQNQDGLVKRLVIK